MNDPDDDQWVVAAADLDPEIHEHGIWTFRQYRLGHATVGEDLGASLYELDPGHRTWPAHYHTANEEAVYVLDGRLTLRLGGGDGRIEFSLEPGDYVALPTGPARAHEIEGGGSDTARFLVVSTMTDPDFTVLTEERKTHLIAGDPPGKYEDRYISRTLDLDAEVPYWDAASGEGEGDGESGDADGQGGDDDDDALGDPENADPDSHAVSASDLAWTEHDYADRGRPGHRFRRKQLGAAAGGADLGASLYDVPAGKRTWLPHYHAGNAEAMYVLDGDGTVTLGHDRAEHAVSSGDYVALPRGEAGYHDVLAGEGGLRYLLVSTMNEPDVTVYPDDGKVGLYAGSAPGGDGDERTLSTYLDREAEVAYWD